MFGLMLSEAWHAMGANRLRTFLTMLGMMIGVAAVIMMLAIGKGTQFVVEQSIASMGSNLFIILPGSTTSGGLRLGMGARPNTHGIRRRGDRRVTFDRDRRTFIPGGCPARLWAK